MQKIRKILRAVSEKTALPTNQPTNQLLLTTPILQDLADAGPSNKRQTNLISPITENLKNSILEIPKFFQTSVTSETQVQSLLNYNRGNNPMKQFNILVQV